MSRFVSSDGKEWLVPTSVDELVEVLDRIPAEKSVRLVAGNTGRGIFKFYLDRDANVGYLGFFYSLAQQSHRLTSRLVFPISYHNFFCNDLSQEFVLVGHAGCGGGGGGLVASSATL